MDFYSSNNPREDGTTSLIFQYPLCSSVIAPSDNYMFVLLALNLKGNHFATDLDADTLVSILLMQHAMGRSERDGIHVSVQVTI